MLWRLSWKTSGEWGDICGVCAVVETVVSPCKGLLSVVVQTALSLLPQLVSQTRGAAATRAHLLTCNGLLRRISMFDVLQVATQHTAVPRDEQGKAGVGCVARDGIGIHQVRV